MSSITSKRKIVELTFGTIIPSMAFGFFNTTISEELSSPFLTAEILQLNEMKITIQK